MKNIKILSGKFHNRGRFKLQLEPSVGGYTYKPNMKGGKVEGEVREVFIKGHSFEK